MFELWDILRLHREYTIELKKPNSGYSHGAEISEAFLGQPTDWGTESNYAEQYIFSMHGYSRAQKSEGKTPHCGAAPCYRAYQARSGGPQPRYLIPVWAMPARSW